MSAYEAMVAERAGTMGFLPGDRVKVGENDAKAPCGAEGTVLRIAAETGNPIVDVAGRGRVALTPLSLRLVSRSAGAAETSSVASTGNGHAEAEGAGPDAAMAIAHVGEPPAKRRHTPEARAKMSEAAKRRRQVQAAEMLPKDVLIRAPEAAPSPVVVLNEARSGAGCAGDRAAVRTVIALAAREQLSAATLLALCRLLARLEGEGTSS